MSKILNAQRRLKTDKNNKFTFLYNAAQNNSPQNEILENLESNNHSADIPETQSSSSTIDAISPNTAAPTKEARSHLGAMNILRISIVLLAAALITLNVRNLEEEKLNHDARAALAQGISALDSRISQLRNSVSVLENQFSLETAADKSIHTEFTAALNEQGIEIYKLTQDLSAAVKGFNEAELDLSKMADSFNDLSVKLRIQESEIVDLKTELAILAREQSDLKAKFMTMPE